MEESIKIIKTFCEKYNYESCFLGPEKWIQNECAPKTIQYSNNETMNGVIALRFEGNYKCIMETYTIIEKINTLKDLIKKVDLSECCVCYEKCNTTEQKCIKCSSSICMICKVNIKKELYIDEIMNSLENGIDHLILCEIIAKLPFNCPVCKTEN